jgi:hypothetical protein
MQFRSAVVAVAVAAGSLFGLTPASPASAYVAQDFVEPVTLVDSNGENTIHASLRLRMAAGEARNLRGEIVIGDGRDDGQPQRVAIGQKIMCYRAGTTTLVDQIWNSQNLLADLRYETMVARFLFIAPTAGDYDCHMRVYINDGLAPGRETARLRSGFLGDIWGPMPAGTYAQLLAGARDTVLQRSGAGQHLHALTYTPPAGTTTFQVTGDIYVSSCYDGPGTCPSGQTYPPRPGTAQVYSRVVATPSSTSPGCSDVASPATVSPVTSDVHHLRIRHQATVTLPATGCGSWRLSLFARENGGSLPFVVHTFRQYSVVYARVA